MPDGKRKSSLEIAASLAGGGRAVLLIEQLGRAHIEAAIYPEGDGLGHSLGARTAPSLEALANAIDGECASFSFSARTLRGSMLLPGIPAAHLPERTRTQLQLLAETIAESLDDTPVFAFADHLAEGIAVYRYPGGEPEIEYINPSASRRIGISPERVAQDPGTLFRDAGNRRVAFDVLARARLAPGSGAEHQVRALDGSLYWVHLRVFPLPELNDAPRALVISSDTSGARASAERESILTSCIDVAADAIAVYRIDRERSEKASLLYSNQAFSDLAAPRESRRPPSPLTLEGENLVDFCISRLDLGGTLQCEMLVRTGDGKKPRPMELHARHLKPEGSTAEFVSFSLHDVGARVEGERERRMLAHAIEESLDFFAIGDFVPPSQGGSHIRYINPAFTHRLGYTAEELLGRSSGILISPNNTRQTLTTLTESIEHRTVVNLELMMRTKDGRDIWCEFVAQPIFDESAEGGYWLTVGRDITLRKQSTAQLALLTWVLDEIDARVTIYEPAGERAYEVSYENAASAERGRYLFLDLVREGGIVGRLVNDRQFAERPLRTMVADSNGKQVTEIEIRALFDGASRLAAVITMERDISTSDRTEGFPSAARLALVTAGMQNIIHAPTFEGRLRALSITLNEGFDASLSLEPASDLRGEGLTFEPQHRRATISFYTDEPKRAAITWTSHLGELELTTLRLALETFLGAVQPSR